LDARDQRIARGHSRLIITESYGLAERE
jgi:hypothetical protein